MSFESELSQSLPADVRQTLAGFCISVYREMCYLRDEGGRSYKVVRGQRIRHERAGSIYCFDMEAELYLAEDAPITLHANKRRINGAVIGCEDFQITLSLEEDIGEQVPTAFISAEPWKLLESLIKRLMKLNTSNHQIALKLMQQGPSLATKHPVRRVAAGQQAAKAHVRNNPITVIWGPPGTGKTHTMAEIAISHILAGKSVLAVSHSNVSVDGIALKVAELIRQQGHDSLINNGDVLRFGHVRDEKLDAEDNLVAHKYALKRNARLKDELKRLSARRAELKKQGVRSSSELVDIQKRMGRIRKAIAADEKACVARARFVATTASKMYADKLFEGRQYDLVMFDEVSMAYVAQIVCAAMHARQKLVIVGDFRQLAPIASAPKSQGTLTKDIFSYLGIIDSMQVAHYHPWLVMLNEQRRMHPRISAFSSDEFYNMLLQDHQSVVHARDRIAAAAPCAGSAMALVDLRGTYCAAASNTDHSRFNVLAAITSFGLALEAAKNEGVSVGVIAPYIAQARLVRALIQDYQEHRNKDMVDMADVACSTVHQFQGSERDVIVLDTVESYPAGRPGILTYRNTNGSVDRLVNVAVTRARGKLITVANESFWDESTAGKGNAFGALCRHQKRCDTLVGVGSGEVKRLLSGLDFGPNIEFFDDTVEARAAFLNDISMASQKIVFSFPDGKLTEPFATTLYHIIRSARSRGVEVLAKCRNYDDLSDDWRTFTWQSDDAVFPLAVIDGSVCWYGMPPSRLRPPIKRGIAQPTVLETPFRIIGFNTVSMLWSIAALDQRKTDDTMMKLAPRGGTSGVHDDGRAATGLPGYIANNEKCTVCGKPMSLAKSYKSGAYFLKCPSCNSTRLLDKEAVNRYMYINRVRCPKCGSTMTARLGKYGIYITCDEDRRHTFKPNQI